MHLLIYFIKLGLYKASQKIPHLLVFTPYLHFCFTDLVSCNPGWPQTHHVAKDDPELVALLSLLLKCKDFTCTTQGCARHPTQGILHVRQVLSQQCFVPSPDSGYFSISFLLNPFTFPNPTGIITDFLCSLQNSYICFFTFVPCRKTLKVVYIFSLLIFIIFCLFHVCVDMCGCARAIACV